MFTGKCDVWADFRNKLPFRDSTVDIFYSFHVIEHLPDMPFHFAEMYRCLKPGGVFRVGAPNGDSAIRKYIEGDAGWFGDWPDKRSSIGGRFENFIFCRQEHLTIITPSWIQELATGAGFVDLKICQPGTETGYPQLINGVVLNMEPEPNPDCPQSLVLEGRKPNPL
jgi:SAM-dependent methyltransferase